MFGQPGGAVLGSAASRPILQRPDPLGQHGDVLLDRRTTPHLLTKYSQMQRVVG